MGWGHGKYACLLSRGAGKLFPEVKKIGEEKVRKMSISY